MTTPYDYQKQVAHLLREEQKNLLVLAPTGAGKTESGFDGLEAAGTRGIYLAPTRALCNEKAAWLRQRFPEARVVIGNKDYSLSLGSFRESHLRVLTPWKLGVILHNDPSFAQHCPLIVVDEIQNLDPETELIITKMKLLYPGVRVVGLSATIHEDDEPKLAAWLGALVVKSEIRPVPLVPRVVNFVSDLTSEGEEFTAAEFREGSKQLDRLSFDGFLDSFERVAAVVDHIRDSGDQSPILVYTPYRERARQLASHLAKGSKNSQLQNAADRLPLEAGDFTDTLKSVLPKGVGLHHGGLTQQERELVFDLARDGQLPVVVCCETLSQGINLPARHVIFECVHREPEDGDERRLMDVGRFWNMAGRAGRPQFDSVGYTWVITATEIELVEVEEVLFKHKASRLVSRIYDEYFLTAHVAGLIQLGYSTPAKLVGFMQATYFGTTLQETQPLVEQLERIIARLIDEGFAQTLGHLLVLTDRGQRLARLGLHPSEYKAIEHLINAQNADYETWIEDLVRACGEFALKGQSLMPEQVAEVIALGMTAYAVKCSWQTRDLADYVGRLLELSSFLMQFNKVDENFQKTWRSQVADRFLFGEIEFARKLARILPRPTVKRILRNFGPSLEKLNEETGQREIRFLDDSDIFVLSELIWSQTGLPQGSEVGKVAGVLGITEAKLRRIADTALAAEKEAA